MKKYGYLFLMFLCIFNTGCVREKGKNQQQVKSEKSTETSKEQSSREGKGMNNQVLGQLIHSLSKEVEGKEGNWAFKYQDSQLMVVTDEKANRMRIISSIRDIKEITAEDLAIMMHANFDRALDARYAIWEGRVWSVFIHPLKSLNKDDFVSGVSQVATLRENYGTSYSSGGLMFGGEKEEKESKPKPDNTTL